MISPKQAKEAYEKFQSERKAAEYLGLPKTTFRRLKAKAENESVTEEEESLALKVQKQDKIIKNLRSELKKAQDESLTNQEVRNYILDIKEKDTQDLPEWLASPAEYRKDDNIPCTLLSDLHWGETVDPKQVFGLNEYNMEIAAQRLHMYVENVKGLLRTHLAPRDYAGIVVCLGGDNISGDIHLELTETNEQAIMPVMLDLYSHMRVVLTELADEFGQVFVPCVIGNHGRNTQKPQSKRQAFKNFDWILYHLLSDWFANDERINFLIGDDDEIQFQVLNHTYRLTHGAAFRGGQGYIGALAPIIRGDHKKRLVSVSQDTVYDTLLMGHFHRTMYQKNIIVTGSLVGYNEFAADNNLEYELPKQMLWLTDPKYGKVSPMEVFCADPDDFPIGKNNFTQVAF